MASNGLQSFIAHFYYLVATQTHSSVVDLMAPYGECRNVDSIIALLGSPTLTDIVTEVIDNTSLNCKFEIRDQVGNYMLNLKLEDQAGRYLKIVRADIN